MSKLYRKQISSPVGTLSLYATDTALVGVYFPIHRGAPVMNAHDVETHEILDRAIRELEEYFAGERTVFTTPLEPRGTPFQQNVWRALTEIPYAGRCSYKTLAEAIGRPQSSRAVGTANGRNPLSIFVPCHRVVGSNGKLTGYAGGIAAKRWLLEHESKFVVPDGQLI